MSQEKRDDFRPCPEDVPDDYQVMTLADDWILSGVSEDEFYDFKWWSDFAESRMRPLVKRTSLAKETVMKAIEMAMASFYYGDETVVQKKRIKFILRRSIDDGIDGRYEKETMSLDDVRFSEKEYGRLYGLARNRMIKTMKKLDELDDGSDPDYKERSIVRNQAFEAAYLCLRTEDPEGTFYIMWGLIDRFYDIFQRAISQTEGPDL